MNAWQLAQQLRHELATITWQYGSGHVVFGERSVLVVAGSPTEDQIPPGFPFALITVDGGDPDPDEPSLITQAFSVTAVAESAGDPMGEHGMIGSSRADLGKSVGAGILEVAERVRAATQKLTGFDGASIVVSGSAIGEPLVLGRGRHMVSQRFTLSALCTSQPFYASPQQFRRNGNTLRWRGDHCEARFDFLQYRVGWLLGSTPPTSPDQAGVTTVYSGTARECVTPIVGNRSYAVWADYSPRGVLYEVADPLSSATIVGSWVYTS